MEQLPALSTVLCAVLLIPTWGAGLTVRQSPVVRAYVGETATLICSFKYRWGSMVNVKWTRAPGVVLESHHPFYSGRLNMSDLDLLRKGEATLTLSKLEKRDSGLYQCQISIRQGESGTGAGTELRVMGRNQSDTGLTVLQSPVVLRASPGETVNLSCSFENRPGSAVNVRWTRAPGVILESHHPFYKGRFKVFFRDLLQKEEVTLTLSDLEKRDSGLYRCHVSNHQGESWTGAGTKLQVMGRNESDTGLTVRQSPAVLRASPGETVNLSCSFENRQGSVVKATWTIAPGVVLESHHPFYSGRLNVSDLDLLRKGEVTLTLSELEKRDSGLYQCQISIHQGESGTGAGTELQVMGRNQSDTGLTVLQSPAVLRASPGETVNLSCSFENRQGSVAKASWTRAPGVVLESHHPFYKGRLNVSDLDLLRKGEATLTLSELEKRDSGLCQCHISNCQGESGTGAGTKLQVTGRNQSDTGKEPAPVGCFARELLYQVTIALGLLLILGLVATLLLKRRQAPPPSQPRQRQPKGHGSRGAEESESVQYAEIKIQTPGRREHTSNHAQRR
ncbi:unnamed protein product [Lepidochelys olivacea]